MIKVNPVFDALVQIGRERTRRKGFDPDTNPEEEAKAIYEFISETPLLPLSVEVTGTLTAMGYDLTPISTKWYTTQEIH